MAVKEIITSHYRTAKDFYVTYERFLVPALLIGGFIIDYITFTSFEVDITLLFLIAHWVIAGLAIVFMHLYDARTFPRLPAWSKYLRLYCPLVIQFMFGVLLRFSLIFYWFYGAVSVSWPLLAIIVTLMVVHDQFRHYFDRPVVQISAYFFTTLSLFSVALPFFLNSSGIVVFIIATAGSLAVFIPYLYYLSRAAETVRRKIYPIASCIAVIVVFMNVLYFMNIIPPIPFALRQAEVYHSIALANHQYVARGESEPFLKTLLSGQTLHLVRGERMYLYTAIFAPADMQATIIHHWQHYDSQKKEWITMAQPALSISGGRKDGYKGYTWTAASLAGKWRVSVENKQGQVLGKISFTVERVAKKVPLQEYIK
jgi:hypothetical protein